MNFDSYLGFFVIVLNMTTFVNNGLNFMQNNYKNISNLRITSTTATVVHFLDKCLMSL